MAEYKKPLPIIDDDTREFWEGCKKHELLIQRCTDCGTFRFPPRTICHKCLSMNFQWIQSAWMGCTLCSGNYSA